MRFNATFTAIVLSIGCAGAFAQAATAPAATPGIDKRQQNQEQRIDQGQASGQLTGRESRRLDRQQARINRAETAAKADGAVTQGERKHLHAMQNHASKSIHHQKHDAQTRNGAKQPMPPSGPGTGPNASPGG
jgi:hypothetical protein